VLPPHAASTPDMATRRIARTGRRTGFAPK
jgi:hypothetical protein